MVIRHPLVEDHYKNPNTNFLLSSVPPKQKHIKHHTEGSSRQYEFEILIFILNSSTFCSIYILPVIKQHKSLCASYTQLNELVRFISFEFPRCTEDSHSLHVCQELLHVDCEMHSNMGL